MTDITPLIPEGRKVIESYGNHGFTVTKVRYDSAIVVLADDVFASNAKTIHDISDTEIEFLKNNSDKINILLVGCGDRIDFLSKENEAKIKLHNISIEYMDTGAACRTYNVLLSEERKVAAFIIAV